MNFTHTGTEIKPIFVARQPIFDTKERVWAYELLFRSSATANTSALTPEDVDKATATVITDGFTLAFHGADKSKKAFINFPERLLLNDIVYALPKDICVIEIQENVQPTQELQNALQAIKSRGYTVALDNYMGADEQRGLLPYIDIVKVDMLAVKQRALQDVTRTVAAFSCRLLAEKIEDAEAYRTAEDYGFTLFQGYHFSRPETLIGSKAPTPIPTKLRLIQVLADDDFDIREATSALSSDPALCYRLLYFINSAAFSLRAKIQSVQQAVTLLGRQRLRLWLLAIVISEFDSSPRVQEAAYISLLRARYLESMAALHHNPLYPAETMFLLGLFSKLDAVIGDSMTNLLQRITLASGLENALLGRPSAYLEWLDLAEAIEVGNWADVDAFLDHRNLDSEKSALIYSEAMNWANAVLNYPE